MLISSVSFNGHFTLVHVDLGENIENLLFGASKNLFELVSDVFPYIGWWTLGFVCWDQ